MSLSERRLWRNGTRVPLNAREAELLGLLVERCPTVMRKDEIIEHLWGGVATDLALALTICRLRQKLRQFGGNAPFIKTVPGVGFQFIRGEALAPRGECFDVLSPDFSSYQLALGAYRQRTQASILSAIRSLENLRASHPHFLPAIVTLARAYMVMGIRHLHDPRESHRKARSLVQLLLESDPRSAAAYATLAILSLFYEGDREQAHRATQHALVLAPHSPFAHKAVFWDRLARRDFHGALEQGDLLVQSAPTSAQCIALFATALYMSARHDEAQKCFGMALELDPLNCTALYYGASNCIALEDYDTAEDFLSSAYSAGVTGMVENLRGGPSHFLRSIDPLYASSAAIVRDRKDNVGATR